jgi:predicted RNA binding protein YcfA (HicA-like mRNA interferase family)
LKLPRDLGGFDLAKLLSRFGYQITRQKGSHLRLTSNMRGFDHHVTIPNHDHLKLGTLNSVMSEVAGYLGIPRAELERDLFER